MNKLFKKVFLLGLLLCLALGICGIAVACADESPSEIPSNDDETHTVTYTVTVTCDDAVILSIVKVQLKSEDGTSATEAKRLTKGSVSFELEGGAYTVEITDAAGYEYAATTLTAENPTATVALVPEGTLSDGGSVETVTYTVTVTLPDDTPVTDLMVQLSATAPSGEGNGTHSAMTNSAGIATFSLPAGTYEVHIDENQTTYPALYTFNNAKYTVSATALDITVVFDPAPLMKFTVGLVYANKSPVEGLTVALHRTTNNENTGNQVAPTATASAVTDSEGVAVIEAPAGAYTIVLPDCPANYGYQKGLVVDTNSPNIPNPALKIGPIELTELGTDLYNRITVAEGTHNFTATAKRKEFYFQFNSPSKAGYYLFEGFGDTYDSASGGGNVDTYFKLYGASNAYINPNPIATADDENGLHFVYELPIESKYLGGNIWVFSVGVDCNLKGDETADFGFTITYDREINEATEVTLSPHATQTKSAYNAPADSTFTRLSYDDVDKLFKDANGVYHYGSADGPVVLVLLSGNTYPLGMDNSFEGALLESGGMGFTYSTYEPDDDNVITYYNLYEYFLPEYIAAANSAGMHPLVEELKLFLQHYYGCAGMYEYPELSGWPTDTEGGFLFACGYFKSDAPNTAAYDTYEVALTTDDKAWYAYRRKQTNER